MKESMAEQGEWAVHDQKTLREGCLFVCLIGRKLLYNVVLISAGQQLKSARIICISPTLAWKIPWTEEPGRQQS